MARKMGKWIKFELTKSFGVTKAWEVSTNKEVSIGHIKWYSPWRKYCFFPIGGTVYALSCLRDIAYFMEREMIKRKEGLSGSK